MIVALALALAIEAPSPKVGERVEIIRRASTENSSTDGSIGSSSDVDTVMEQVLEVRTDGVVYLLDVPLSAEQEERASQWQLPARILRAPDGKLTLLNRAELEKRRDAWLKAANWDARVCGKTIFTWNAFKIECDPESALSIFKAFDLHFTEIRDGASYADSQAGRAGPLRKVSDGPAGAVYDAEMAIDAEIVRNGDVETDIVVAEISGKPITPEEARNRHKADAISGTMTIRFEADESGLVWRRTRKSLIIKKTSEASSTTKTTETIERRAIPAAK